MAFFPRLVNGKLDQAVEILGEREVDLRLTLVREWLPAPQRELRLGSARRDSS